MNNLIQTLKTPKAKRYAKLILSGILIAVATKLFIIYSNIFSPGIAGLSQGISYTVYEVIGESINMDREQFNNTFYWLIYGTLNIPILFFTYNKFGKTFMFDSMLVLTSSLLFNMFLTHTPGIKDASFVPGYDIGSVPAYIEYTVTTISGLIGGLIYGYALGQVFKQGASSMGIDPIIKFLSRDKDMSFRGSMFAFSFFNSLIWIMVGDSMAGTIVDPASFFQVLLSPRLLGSVLFIGTYALTAELLMKDKKVKAEISSIKTQDIIRALKEIDEKRSYSIVQKIGGYHNTKREVIEIVMYKSELNEILPKIMEVDPKSFIVTNTIAEVHGNFNKIAMNKYERRIESHRTKRKNDKTNHENKEKKA